MTDVEAYSWFQLKTGRAADWVDFRNMLDEETDFLIDGAWAMKQRLAEDKAREMAVDNLIGWCIEGPGIGFGKTMTSLAAFVASHRRPAIWAALLGSIRHVVVKPAGEAEVGSEKEEEGKDGKDGQDGQEGS